MYIYKHKKIKIDCIFNLFVFKNKNFAILYSIQQFNKHKKRNIFKLKN